MHRIILDLLLHQLWFDFAVGISCILFDYIVLTSSVWIRSVVRISSFMLMRSRKFVTIIKVVIIVRNGCRRLFYDFLNWPLWKLRDGSDHHEL